MSTEIFDALPAITPVITLVICLYVYLSSGHEFFCHVSLEIFYCKKKPQIRIHTKYINLHFLIQCYLLHTAKTQRLLTLVIYGIFNENLLGSP